MKYMGSKSRIAKYIVPILQECIDSNNVTTYIEPFVGGGNIIDKIRCQERIGSDINPYLIALLKRVQEGKPLLNEVSKDTYSLVKDAWKDGTDKDKYEQWYVGNIGFLASYNGKWFDGGYAKPNIIKTSKEYTSFVFSNNSKIEVVTDKYKGKGKKYNSMIIDKNIDSELIKTIFAPFNLSYKEKNGIKKENNKWFILWVKNRLITPLKNVKR